MQLLCVARKPLAHHCKKKKYHVITCAPAANRRLDRGAPGLSGSPFIKSALSNWALRSLAIGGLRLLGWFVENFSTAESTLKIVLVTLEGGGGNRQRHF